MRPHLASIAAAALIAAVASTSFPSPASADPMGPGRFNPGVDNPNMNSTMAGGVSTWTSANCVGVAGCTAMPGGYPSNGAYPAWNLGVTSASLEGLAGQPNGSVASAVPIAGYTGTGYNNGSGIDPSWHAAEWGHLTISVNGGAGLTTIAPGDRLGVCMQPGASTAADGLAFVPTPYFSSTFTGVNHVYQSGGVERSGVFFPVGHEFQAAAANWVLAWGYDGDPHPAVLPALTYINNKYSLDLLGTDADYRQTGVLYGVRLLLRTVNRGTTLPFDASLSAFPDLGNWVSADATARARVAAIGEALAAEAMRSTRWGPYSAALDWVGAPPAGVGETGTLRVRVTGAATANTSAGLPAAAPTPDSGIYGTARPDGAGDNWNADAGVSLVAVPAPSSTNGATVTPIASADGTPAGLTDDQGYALFDVTINADGFDEFTVTTGEIPHWEFDFMWGDGSQDVTYPSTTFHRVSADLPIDIAADPSIASQVSDTTPPPGATLTDAIILEGLATGTTATVQIQAFDLTADPTGSGTPLVDVTRAGLTNGTTTGLAPWPVTVAQAGHTIGYRHRITALSDGSLAAPTAWSELGIASETAVVEALVDAEVHLRKSVSGESGVWVNAQSGVPIAYSPSAAPGDPRDGSFDDGAGDAGDGVPLFAAGESVSFRYEVWLEEGSTGVVRFDGGTTGVVTDNNGTPADTSDDFDPVYVSGDDGDGVLELGETWVYEALDQRTAVAGESYRNYSSIPSGDVVRPGVTDGPVEGSTIPREDPAGYEVPEVGTSVANPMDDSRFIGPEGGAMVDTVDYCGLVPGVEVTVSGELQRLPAPVTATGVIASTTFTPQASCGSVEVSFTVPASATPGVYVVFEELTVDGRVIAVHDDPADQAQTFRKRAPISIDTRACEASVTAADAATVAAACDVVTVGGEPGDVVTGTVTAYPILVDGTRDCARPGPSVAWQATIPSSGGTVVERTPMVDVPVGSWEWIETARAADGRTWSRDCATAPRDADESFRVIPGRSTPGRGTPGRGLPGTGSDVWSILVWGAGFAAAGVAAALLSRRRRRAQAG